MYTLQNKNDVDRIILQAPHFHWKYLPGKLKIPLLKPIIKLLSKSRVIQNKYHDHFRDYVLGKRLPRLKNHVLKDQLEEVRGIVKIVMKKFDNNLSKRASTEFGVSGLYIDLTEEVSEIKNKTLILWGSDDPTLNKNCGLELEKLIPNSKYVEIEDGTHDVLLEKYTEVCHMIEKFLSENK